MDVIGTGPGRAGLEVRVRRRLPAGWRVPLAVGSAATVALVGVLVGRLEATGGLLGGRSVGDLTGSMVLDLQPNACEPQEMALSDQTECRGEDWRGTIAVEARGHRTGPARLQSSASYVFTDAGTAVSHWWGTAEVTLDDQACTGTYGLSAYSGSGEGGGSLHLRCDDGSVLGAAITASGDNPPVDDGDLSVRITVALTDGYFAEGPDR